MWAEATVGWLDEPFAEGAAACQPEELQHHLDELKNVQRDSLGEHFQAHPQLQKQKIWLDIHGLFSAYS